MWNRITKLLERILKRITPSGRDAPIITDTPIAIKKPTVASVHCYMSDNADFYQNRRMNSISGKILIEKLYNAEIFTAYIEFNADCFPVKLSFGDRSNTLYFAFTPNAMKDTLIQMVDIIKTNKNALLSASIYHVDNSELKLTLKILPSRTPILVQLEAFTKSTFSLTSNSRGY